MIVPNINNNSIFECYNIKYCNNQTDPKSIFLMIHCLLATIELSLQFVIASKFLTILFIKSNDDANYINCRKLAESNK